MHTMTKKIRSFKHLPVVGIALTLLLIQACSSGSSPEEPIQDTGQQVEQPTGGVNMSAGTPRDCGNDHPAVGAQAELSTVAHRVAGTVRVIDNCTLQIDNFTYDGRGPAVFFWASVDLDYAGPGYFQIGESIHGTEYNNETVVLDLPAGKTLSDFNSLSVWCTLFGATFGDATFDNGQP